MLTKECKKELGEGRVEPWMPDYWPDILPGRLSRCGGGEKVEVMITVAVVAGGGGEATFITTLSAAAAGSPL